MTSKEATRVTPARRLRHRLGSDVRRFLMLAVSMAPLTPVRIARRRR